MGRLTRDHYAVSFTANIAKPTPYRKTVSFRKLRSIDVEISASTMLQQPGDSADVLVKAYNDGLKSLVSAHAPLRTKTIVQRPGCPWYTDDLHQAKHLRRKLERKWRKSRLTIDQQIFRNQCVVVNKLLKESRVSYYSDKVNACGRDTKGIYRITKHLLGDTDAPTLPNGSPKELAQNFSNFFTQKIVSIRNDLQSSTNPLVQLSDTHADVSEPLVAFVPASQEEVRAIIKRSPDKSCELDPLPTWLLKHYIVWMSSFLSLPTSSTLQWRDFKCARIRPLLKKPGLDHDTLKHYRPVSNLPFISKILEKVVDSRLERHLVTNSLHEVSQSAYRKFHSTETALLKVQNDILQSLDQSCVSVLILLDLSAAFDTIDHQTLLRRLMVYSVKYLTSHSRG